MRPSSASIFAMSVIAALTACAGSAGPAAAASQPAAHTPSADTANRPTTTPIIRTGRTISDQPLRLPQGDAEVVAVAVEIPAGAGLPIHQHPWQRFVYVERGTLRVLNHDTGASLDFQQGQVLAEVVGQWHEARAVGAEPVRIVVLDLVPPGVTNMIMRDAPAAR